MTVIAVQKFIRAQPTAEIWRRLWFLFKKIFFLFLGKQIIAVVNRFIANADFRHSENGLATINKYSIRRINEIWIDILRFYFLRFAFDVFILK